VILCSKCILPEYFVGIEFDKNNVCNYCRSYKKVAVKGQEAFFRVIDLYKVQGPYDCVVPLSGGKDSSYVLYAAKRLLGLNPLAVNYNNEFQHECAEKNIKGICKKLGVDLRVVHASNSRVKRYVREYIKGTLPFGAQGLSSYICINCVIGYMCSSLQIAKKLGISLILWGTSEDFPGKDFEMKTKISLCRIFFSRRMPNFLKMVLYHFRQRLEFFTSFNNLFRLSRPRLEEDGIKEIRFYDYFDLSKKEIVRVLGEELDWQKPKTVSGIAHFDCILEPLVGYLYYQRLGYNDKISRYSDEIRAGYLTRDEALRLLAEDKIGEYSPAVEHVLRELKLSDEEIGTIKSLQTRKPYYILPS